MSSPDLATWLLEQIDWTVDNVARRLYEVDRDAALLVMAECDAKRRLVELHRPANPDAVPENGLPGWPDRAWYYCETCGSGEAYEYPTTWPCATLKLLALPYADRPGFREEWKP